MRRGERCTASGQERVWSDRAWIEGGDPATPAVCPDCGGPVGVWVRGSDLFPRAKARAHRAPEGVEPAPYAVLPRGGAMPDEVTDHA